VRIKFYGLSPKVPDKRTPPEITTYSRMSDQQYQSLITGLDEALRAWSFLRVLSALSLACFLVGFLAWALMDGHVPELDSGGLEHEWPLVALVFLLALTLASARLHKREVRYIQQA
jgi:hypothetical protein